MSIAENLKSIKEKTANYPAKLVAVSKTKPVEAIKEVYELGHKAFGENKVQELATKYEALPKDIEWHMIGHLQRNKVKYIAPFVHLIHSIDSLRLLKAVNKEGEKNNRVISCLLQVHIAEEETKFGLSEEELYELLSSDEFKNMQFVKIIGLMGMATNTEDEAQVRKEFKYLKALFEKVKEKYSSEKIDMRELSMGMSGDFEIALEERSTMIRVGSSIFGSREYH